MAVHFSKFEIKSGGRDILSTALKNFNIFRIKKFEF